MLISNEKLLEWVKDRDIQNILRGRDRLEVSSDSGRRIIIFSKMMADHVFQQMEELEVEEGPYFQNFPNDFSTEIDGESKVVFRDWDSSSNFKADTEHQLGVEIPFSCSVSESFMADVKASESLEITPKGNIKHSARGEFRLEGNDKSFVKSIPAMRKSLGLNDI